MQLLNSVKPYIFIILIANSAVLPIHSAYFNALELERIAEIEGYGYKSANLIMLKQVITGEQSGINIQVPEFLPISSAAIQRFLYETGLDLSFEWAQLVKGMSINQAIAEKRFAPGFIEGAANLAQRIRYAFMTLAKAKDFPELEAFLERAQASQWRLMVRSTGKEDTEKLANAGGNLSVANVTPRSTDIVLAIGRVIASYFEERSLSQRLTAQDPTIFNAPFSPVLIQRMVGEEDESNIPTGCVFYTFEPAARVADIRTLQCAFGHNEGVVQSLVPLDTFYLPKNGAIRSIIKVKPKRLAPVQRGGRFGLEFVSNPERIRNKSSLEKDVLKALSKLGDQVESYYGKRMDLELVYHPKDKTIYVVQARPLVFPALAESPSYISKNIKIDPANQIDLTPIDLGSGAVQGINAGGEVLVASTLEDAVGIYASAEYAKPGYDSQKSRRALLKAVIVESGADATSHAAATFRGDGKTIYVTTKMAKLKSWLAIYNLHILLDGQRETAILDKENLYRYQSEEQLFLNRTLIRGWLNYPLPRRVTVEPQSYCLAAPTGAFGPFRTPMCLTDHLRNDLKEFAKLVESLRDDANCATNTSTCLSRRILALQSLEKAEVLNTYAQELLLEIGKPEDLGGNNELLVLFPKRFFEAVLTQEPKAELVDAFSIASVTKEYGKHQNFMDSVLMPLVDIGRLSQHTLRDEKLFLLAEKGYQAALSRGAGLKYLTWLDEILLGEEEAFLKLRELILGLDAVNVLPIWINTLFEKSVAACVSCAASQILDTLYSDYRASRDTISLLAQKLDALKVYDLSIWEKPELFESARTDFQTQFSDYFESDAFVNFTTPLHEMVSVSLMQRYVETFDLTLKTLSATPNSKVKVAHFRTRVEDYLKLFETWLKKAPQANIFFAPKWDAEHYVAKLREILATFSNSESELLPSQGFSVAAAALGSGANFEGNFPRSLEDMFTLIHQSLNTVVSAFLTESLKSLDMPRPLKEIYEGISQLQAASFPQGHAFFGYADSIRFILTGISIDTEGVVYSFNVPLRFHSAKLELVYKKETEKTGLGLAFFGGGSHRWEQIASFVATKAELWKRNCVSEVNEGDVYIEIDEVDGIPILHLKDLVKTALYLTFDSKTPGFEIEVRDETTRMEELINLYIKNGDAKSLKKAAPLLESLIRGNRSIEVAVMWLQRAMTSENNYRLQGSALSILGLFIERDQALTAAEDFVLASYKEGRSWRSSLQSIFSKLLKKGKLQGTAPILAQELLASTDWTKIMQGLELLTALVDNSLNYDLAIEAARNLSDHESIVVQTQRSALLTSLAKQGKAFDLAAVAIQKLEKERVWDCLGLLVALVNQGQLLDLAEELLIAESNQSNQLYTWRFEMLLNAMLSRGSAINLTEAMVLAKLNTTDDQERDRVVSMLNSLVTTASRYSLCARVAKSWVKHADQQVQRKGISLFATLIRTGREYDSAFNAFLDLPESEYDLRVELLSALIAQGQKIDFAIKLVQDNLKVETLSASNKETHWVLGVLFTLILRGHAIDFANQLATDAETTGNIDLGMLAQWIRKTVSDYHEQQAMAVCTIEERPLFDQPFCNLTDAMRPKSTQELLHH